MVPIRVQKKSGPPPLGRLNPHRGIGHLHRCRGRAPVSVQLRLQGAGVLQRERGRVDAHRRAGVLPRRALERRPLQGAARPGGASTRTARPSCSQIPHGPVRVWTTATTRDCGASFTAPLPRVLRPASRHGRQQLTGSCWMPLRCACGPPQLWTAPCAWSPEA